MTTRNPKTLPAVCHPSVPSCVRTARPGARFRRVLLCALACAAWFPAHADSPAADTVLQATLLPFVPLHGSTGQPLIQVKVNGTTDATFMLDTGTSISFIRDTLAAQLKLTPRHTAQVLLHGKPVAVVAAPIELGRFNFPDNKAGVLSDKPIFADMGQKVSGIIGMSLLKAFALVIDFQKHTILIIDGGGLSNAGLKAAGFANAVCLPLSYNKDNLPTVQAVFVNGLHQGTEALTVDTGSDNTQISNSLAHRLHLPVLQGAEGFQGLTGQYTQSVSQTTMTLGNITVSGLPVTFPSSDKDKVRSVLGMDVLSRCRVLMDFPARKMYLAPPAPPAVSTVPPAPAAPVSVPKP